MVDGSQSAAFGHVRVDSRSVLSSVDSEDSRHQSAHHGFRSIETQVQDMVSGWYGLSSRVFGGRWDGASSNLTSSLDSWQARNQKTRDAMDEYHDEDGGGADEFESTSEDVAAVMAKVNW